MEDNVASLLMLRMSSTELEILPRQDSDFDSIFETYKAEGAFLDHMVCARDAHGGRGLFATCDIAAGEVVAILPRHLRIGQQQACSRLALPANTPDMTALSLFILTYLTELSTESKKKSSSTVLIPTGLVENSNWSAYAKTLPRILEFKNAAVMSTTELSEAISTHGADYASAALSIRRIAGCCSDYITSQLSKSAEGETEPLHEDSALRWAIGMVLSRSHAFGSKNRWLTPIFDLANHRPEALGGGSLVPDDQGRLLFKAGNRAIACGEEITFDYQCRNDALKAAIYGF